jgi:two-component system response regulator YesN
VHNYFNVNIRMAFGKIVEDPFRLDESYLSARRIFRELPREFPRDQSGDSLRFFEDPPAIAGEFAFKDIRANIRRAFEELDTAAFREVISRLDAHFRGRPEKDDLLIEAVDAACNVLYMALSLLPDGDEMVSEIFKDESSLWRSIYRMNSTEAVLDWLHKLGEGCCGFLESQWQNYKLKAIASVRDYIRQNLARRLSLAEVAAVINFSPNYLSRLFTKYAGTGFVEFITAERISAAKEMLARGEGLVYEIAEKLGFENAFYFSKVFKKATGLSPRDFMKQGSASLPYEKY